MTHNYLMKQLRKLLTSALFWEHVLPILFLNGGVFYTLPRIYTKLLAEGHNPVTLFLGAVLAVNLINFYYLLIHFIGHAYVCAVDVSPQAMLQVELDRPAVVLNFPNPVESEASQKFFASTPPKNEPVWQSSYYPLFKLTPFVHLPYELFYLSPILRP